MRKRGSETSSHPEITCSLFAPYPVRPRSLVTTVPSVGSSLSFCPCPSFLFFFFPCYMRQQSRAVRTGKIRQAKLFLSWQLVAVETSGVRDKCLKPSDHLSVVVCFGVWVCREGGSAFDTAQENSHISVHSHLRVSPSTLCFLSHVVTSEPEIRSNYYKLGSDNGFLEGLISPAN